MSLQILYLAQSAGFGKITQTDGSLITLGLGSTVPELPALPAGLTFPRGRKPQWSNARRQSLAGTRSVNQLFFIPLYQWTITYSFLRVLATYPEWQTFLNFFNSLAAAQPFYYTDPLDNLATDQVFGVGDGTTTAFQLCRRLTAGGFPEAIQSPLPPITVKDNGSPTTAFTLGNGGIVNFVTAPTVGHPLSWSGAYRWLVRFDDDFADLSQMDSILYELKKITFSGEKL